jgi:hypothetical protein
MVEENPDDPGRTAAKETSAARDSADDGAVHGVVISGPQPDPSHHSPVLSPGAISAHTPPPWVPTQWWDPPPRPAAFNPAVLSTTEAFVPPVPPPPPPVVQNQDIPITTGSTASVETQVIRATISIVPTLYPAEPTGAVIVQNYVTINIHSTEFREFSGNIDEMLAELRRSNEIAGEVRDKLLAEITAGMAILKSPKPDPRLIDLFLKRPLAYIADKGAGVVIGVAATGALALLGKITGLW